MERAGRAPQPFRTRLQALFAADGRTAVLLRRGPKTHFNLILWDLRRDRFESGQWMKGSIGLSDLSPTGDKLLYRATQYRPSAVGRATSPEAGGDYDPLVERPPQPRAGRKLPRYLRAVATGVRRPPRENTGSWTAVSTPPYFTALAIWPSLGAWTGGGGFLSEREIFLHEDERGMTPVANVPIPPRVKIMPSGARTGGVSPRCSAAMPFYSPDKPREAIWRALGEGGLPLVDWIYDAGEDLLFSGGGKVFRLRHWQQVEPADYIACALLLTDVSQDRFRLLAAPPSALRW